MIFVEVDELSRLYPAVQSGGGVLPRIGGASPGEIARPGPALPGLSRFRAFSRTNAEIEAAVSFDLALMAAMNRPWPDLVFVNATVAASGMTPPETINP